MKKIAVILPMFIVAGLFASCNNDKTEETPVPETPVQEVYQPVHKSSAVDLSTAQKYDYRNAPMDAPATGVTVSYDQKKPYTQPITVKYTYANGDSYTYTIPAEFGLWKNQAGKFRVVIDQDHTVWLQGQTKKGKFHEFVFYGDPKYNGTKVKPNSYRNPPAGEIKYRK